MPDALPLVTVVMPVLNEAGFIRGALAAVLAQDYPADRIEVLVVDGGSTDGTLHQIQSVSDPRVRLLHNPGRIQACALNIGIDTARGDVIVRVDGHTIIAPDYVRQCVRHLHATGADNVGGPQRFVGVTPWGRAIAAAYRSPFGVPSRFTVSTRSEYVDTVYLGAWPRYVFERVGRFDETLFINEDYEFNYRIRAAGGRIFLTPEIQSAYIGRQTPGGLWRQFFRYGGGKFTVLVKFPASARPRHVVAPAFVAILAGGAILAPFSRTARRGWCAVVALYALAAGVAAVQEISLTNVTRRYFVGAGFKPAQGDLRKSPLQRTGLPTAPQDEKDIELLLRLPLVFAGMHIAWGSGFWFAALRWAWRSVAR